MRLGAYEGKSGDKGDYETLKKAIEELDSKKPTIESANAILQSINRITASIADKGSIRKSPI